MKPSLNWKYEFRSHRSVAASSAYRHKLAGVLRIVIRNCIFVCYSQEKAIRYIKLRLLSPFVLYVFTATDTHTTLNILWHNRSKRELWRSQQPAVTRQRTVNNRGMVFCARSVLMAVHATIEYVIPPLSNNCTAADKRRFLRGPCLDVLSREISVLEDSYGSGCELLLLYSW
jgi:hypothetical protein